MADEDARVGEDRCWSCTVANGVAGLLVAVPPLVVAWIRGDDALVVGAGVWAVLVLGFTVNRLLRRGYLPGAERVAKRAGLHDRIGPGRHRGDGDGSEAGAGSRPDADDGRSGDDRGGADRPRG